MLHEEILDLFLKFQDVCNDLHKEWEVYKEIDKQVRLQAEYQEGDKSKISQEKKPGAAGINQQIDKLILDNNRGIFTAS